MATIHGSSATTLTALLAMTAFAPSASLLATSRSSPPRCGLWRGHGPRHRPYSHSSLHRTRQSVVMEVAAKPSADGGPTRDPTGPGALPPELRPYTLGVFSQMLGEGIALSSLPLYLTRLGASPFMVGLAISCFSVMQMTFAPILVGLSSRYSRSLVLRVCLAGAAAASLLIALSGSVYGSVYGVIAGRTLAGVFAAAVPVAQAGVTDILPREQTSLGLSRVSAASQLGVVVGPAASALFQVRHGRRRR